VLRSRKLRIAVTAVASFGSVMGLAAIPAASAADCTVTVKTITGQVVQLGARLGGHPQLAVVGDGEAVRLVAEPLDHVQGRR